MKGLFVTFDGHDGSGKSTLLRLTAEWLVAESISMIIVPEFSTNIVGEFLKNILKKNKFLRLSEVNPSAFTETLYVLADLYSQDEMEIRPAIKQGKIILKERHADSILACQIPKILDDYPLKDSERLFNWLKQTLDYLTKPDLSFFLQVKDEILKERIKARGEQVCINDFSIFKKRQAIYNRLAFDNRKRWIALNNDGDFSDAMQVIRSYILLLQTDLTQKEI